ncbi:MAG: hypothetical protein KJO55_05465 [Gammaproteobacteria bacterium]|nr:hypothetical protein [Gammaproteobacteria bacterium]
MKAWMLLVAAAVVVLVAAVVVLQEAPAPQLPEPVVAVPDIVVATDPEPIAPPPPEPVSEPVAEPAITPPIGPQLVDDKALMEALSEYGFDKLERRWRDWARARGYPMTDASGQMYYDQPYEQYDNLTLKGLADNGDMWAAQILANRIAKDNPAEALELFRTAAARGSVYAMNEISALYARISNDSRDAEFKSDDKALEQVFAMRDSPVDPLVSSYAWNVVGTMSGSEPMFGDMNAGQIEGRMSEEQVEEACTLAQGLYDELSAKRDSLGLGGFDRSPPPMVYADSSRQPRCGYDFATGMSLESCREMAIKSGDEEATVWLCDE